MAEASASPALGLLYWLYEQRLVRQIRDGPIPRHVGIILSSVRYLRAPSLTFQGVLGTRPVLIAITG